jgi:hypothetical protein
MSAVSLRNIFRVQNSLSFVVFLTFPLAQACAFLLWCAPRNETLWFLSVKLNRLTDPVTSALDTALHYQPIPAWVLIGVLCLLMPWAGMRRNRLVSAALVHIALGISVVSSADLFQQLVLRHQSAHLGIIFDSSSIGWSIGTTLSAAVVLAGFCIINHILYLHGSAANDERVSAAA